VTRPAVHVDRERPARPDACSAHALAIEPKTPHVEELPEGERPERGRLDMNDPGRVMGVDRGEDTADLVDPDVGWHHDRDAVDDEVEMLVGVLR
jgi:hypothetical protein